MNINSGLMALANAGTGYFNRQQVNHQLNYNNQMQALTLHNAQQRDQQNTKNIQNAQAASDDAMAVSAGLAPPTGGIPGQTTPSPGDASSTPPQQQEPVQGFINYNTKMAQLAKGRGDDLGYQQHMTNAINAKNDQLRQQGTQATADLTTLKATQLGASLVGSIFSGVTDQSSYDAARMQAASDSSLPPDIRTNMTKLPAVYNPASVSRVMQTGITVADQAALKIKTLAQEASQSHQEGMLSVSQQRAQLDKQRTDAQIAHQTNQAKAGAVPTSATPQQLKQAAPIAAEVFFPNDSEAIDTESLLHGPGYNLGNVDSSKGPIRATKYDFTSPMMTTLVDRTNQALRGNRSLTFNQEFRNQAQLAKDSGEFQQTSTPTKPGFLGGPGSWGAEPASTTSKFNPGDGSAAHPNIFYGQPKEDLLVGQHYQTGSGTVMWTKEGWAKQ